MGFGGTPMVPSSSSALIASWVSCVIAGVVIVFCTDRTSVSTAVEVLGIGVCNVCNVIPPLFLPRTSLGTFEGLVTNLDFVYFSAAIQLFDGLRLRSTSLFFLWRRWWYGLQIPPGIFL